MGFLICRSAAAQPYCPPNSCPYRWSACTYRREILSSSSAAMGFSGTNDLSGAVAQSIDSGANYYTLAYSPGSSDVHGEYRRITVRLTDVPNAGRYSLSYRRGYYTDASAKDVQTSNSQSSASPGATYRRVAMSHGAPAPEDIIFRVSAHPADVVTQSASAEGDQLASGNTVKGPFRRITVRFTSLPQGITFTEQPDGRHDAAVSFDDRPRRCALANRRLS